MHRYRDSADVSDYAAEQQPSLIAQSLSKELFKGSENVVVKCSAAQLNILAGHSRFIGITRLTDSVGTYNTKEQNGLLAHTFLTVILAI